MDSTYTSCEATLEVAAVFNSKELEIIYKKLWADYSKLTDDEKQLMYKVESLIRNTPTEYDE